MQKIIRKTELDKLLVLKDKNLIKIVTGVRRAGKPTLLLQFQDLLKAENPNVSVISINMDLPDFRFLAEKNWKEIYDYIKNLLQESATKSSCFVTLFLRRYTRITYNYDRFIA